MQALRARRDIVLLILSIGSNGVSGQSLAPIALYPWECTPGTHWVGGWMGLRVGLDIKARKKIF
jgi:hypothetical protein